MMRAVAYCFLALPNLVVTTAIYNHFGGDPWRLPLLGLLYGAVIFLTVLVHEAGHALAASIFGCVANVAVAETSEAARTMAQR